LKIIVPDNRLTHKLDLLAIASVLCLFVGFYFSRVVSNVGVLLGAIYVLTNYREALLVFKDKWVWTFIAMACLPLLSDILSNGIDTTFNKGVLKLLILFYPFFIFTFKPSSKWISYINRFIILSVLLSSLYSLFHYFTNLESILKGYNRAKVMHVLAYQDHIRISWLGVIAILLSFFEYRNSNHNYYKYCLLLVIVFQVLFLHILMAKTGLVLLYGAAVVVLLYSIFVNKKYKLLFIFPILISLPIIAYFTIPSFKQRADFMRYDFGHYSQGKYRPGLSDALRYYSIKSGIETIKKQPLLGVGYSNVINETSKWYKANVPSVPESNYYLPSNQYIIYWAGIGVIGLLVLLLHVVIPLFGKYKNDHLIFLMFFVPAIVSFLFETHLEGQSSIFIYCFFACWFYYISQFDTLKSRSLLVE
jgi:O-antigen ligase